MPESKTAKTSSASAKKTTTTSKAPAKTGAANVVKKQTKVQQPSPQKAEEETQPSVEQQTQEAGASTVTSEFAAVLSALAEVSKRCKELTVQVKQLQKHVAKEHKDLEKATRGRRKKKYADGEKPKRAPSGFAKPTNLSPELCKFLGVSEDTMKARTEVTKFITDYIKEHNLQNQQAKKEILPDKKLGALLNIPKGETLTYFNLQKYMKGHYIKPEPAPQQA